jgi:hypothetical protein
MASLVPLEEREARIECAGDRLAYLAVSYGLLLAVAYHSFVRGDAVWDLLALVVMGGIVRFAYRVRHGIVSGRSAATLLATAGIAIAVSALLAIAGR